MARVIASTYEIVEKIGSGGAGIVYLGKHLRLGKWVVLKEDKRTLSTSPEVLRREVDTLKELNHSYIPHVYDYVEQDGNVYTVMDYIEGESLDKALKRGERFSQSQLIEWLYKLLDALRYMHSRPPYGIIHGDIKPANVMITPDKDVRLIDFNIALALGEEGTVRVGYSAGYASPEHYGLDYTDHGGNAPVTESVADQTELVSTEVVSGTKDSTSSRATIRARGGLMDARSDIYSLGAMFYHLITGEKPPKDAKNVVAIKDPSITPALSAIIAKAMAPNPDNRYQSAEEMMEALRRLRRDDPRSRRFRRIRAGVFTLCVILLMAGGFLAFAGQRRMEGLQRAYALAEYSQNALESGNVEGAVSQAASVLKLEQGFFDPDNTAEAQLALTNALGVYDLEDGFKATKLLELPSEPIKTALSPNGAYLAVIYAWEMAVFDTGSGAECCQYPVVPSAQSDVCFLNDDTLAFAGEDGLTVLDIADDRILWTGESATSITCSADGSVLAAIYKDDTSARIYSAEGEVLYTAGFWGRSQWIPANDVFLDAEDNLLALNADGSIMAASFADGSLTLYYWKEDAVLDLIQESSFTHFEGGFCGDCLAFSAFTDESGGDSLFYVLDAVALEERYVMETTSMFHVLADENGIRLANGNILVMLDPVTEEQTPLAKTARDIRAFRTTDSHTLVSCTDDSFQFFDRGESPMDVTSAATTCDFIELSDRIAVIGSRNNHALRVLELEDFAEQLVTLYDQTWAHSETRVCADEGVIVQFRTGAFRLLDWNGGVVAEREIPEAQKIYDMQFRRKGGTAWLEVIYQDGLTIKYSVADGKPFSEEEGDTPDLSGDMTFLTDALRIEAPAHGAAIAYDRETGKLVRELPQEDTLIYVIPAGEYLLAMYYPTQDAEGQYTLLLNQQCETLARLPHFCDYDNGVLYFDFMSAGEIKKGEIYSLEELLDVATAYDSAA